MKTTGRLIPSWKDWGRDTQGAMAQAMKDLPIVGIDGEPPLTVKDIDAKMVRHALDSSVEVLVRFKCPIQRNEIKYRTRVTLEDLRAMQMTSESLLLKFKNLAIDRWLDSPTIRALRAQHMLSEIGNL